MIKVRQIKVKVDLDTEEELLSKITKKLNLKNNKILEYKITKKSIDARDKNDIYFIPCLNPDGMELNIRHNANGVDLNRNFPTKNWQLIDKNDDFFGGKSPASEEETKFVIGIIEEI